MPHAREKRDNSYILRYVKVSPETEIRRRILVCSITLIPSDVF